MQSSLCAFACALALSFPSSAAAGDDPPIAKVEITGARYDQRREDSASTIVVGRDELLRQGDRSVADALKRMPGITVSDSEIRMRGLGNGYTQILLNGVAAPAGFALASLPPELIERVEILRTASAELGMQGIAGTINIVLRSTAGRPRQTLKLGADAQRGGWSPNASGEISGKGEAYTYSVTTALARTRLDTRTLATESGMDRSGLADLLRSTRQRELNIADTLDLSPRATWTLANGDALSWQGYAGASRRTVAAEAHETTSIGAPTTYPERAAQLDLSANWLRSDLGWVRSLGEGGRVELKLGADRSRRHSDFDFGELSAGMRGPGLHFVRADLIESGYRLGAKFSRPVAGGHVLALGWEAAHTERSQSRLGRERVSADAAFVNSDERYAGAIERAAIYLQDEWELSPRWSISAGLRWETLRTVVAAEPDGPVRQRSSIPAPALQALYKAAPGRQWRLGLTRTYKAPTMSALIPRRYTVDNNNSATNPDTQGNPALLPELAWGLDAGYDHYLGKDGLLSASMFVRRIDQVTVQRLFRDGASWVAAPSNEGRAQAHGFALEARLPLAAGAGLRANLARNWSRIAGVPGPDNRIEGQAPLSANVGADDRIGDALTLGASVNFTAAVATRSSANSVASSSPVRGLELYAAWSPDRRLRLRVGGLLRQAAVSGLRYSADGAQRLTTVATPASASLRLTLEYEPGRGSH